MANFLSKRLQVFVSSTYTDLREERQAAVEAILTAGHIPAGMELFTAGNEAQMDVIKQWIDESDVYMLILGGRYGSVEPKSGKSYTQLEYEYAVDTGKELFACVMNEAALKEKVKARGPEVMETENGKLFKDFRALAASKMVRFWDDSKDIKITTGESLSHIARNKELLGWVRPTASEGEMTKLASEIARLSQENAELRGQLSEAAGPLLTEGFTYADLKELLQSKNVLKFFTNSENVDDWENYGKDVDAADELVFLGLLSRRFGRERTYNMTQAGRTFINHFNLEQHRKKNKGADSFRTTSNLSEIARRLIEK